MFCRDPQLLVSARSPQEARAAIEGGADIIDIKEPARGSLGRADAEVIAAVGKLIRQIAPDTLVSAALGEVSSGHNATAGSLQMVENLNLVKCGLSDLLGHHDSWQDRWREFREQAPVPLHTGWVAAGYADHVRAGSPAPGDVLEEGHRAGCAVLLLDTYQKDKTSLFDWISTLELRQLRQRTADVGMKLAVAGRISATDLPQVAAIGPDIVAVRGAACEKGNREGKIAAAQVRQLAANLRTQSELLPEVRSRNARNHSQAVQPD